MHELIGELLDLGLGLSQIVFAQFGIFLEFLQLFVGIPAKPANVYFRVFAVFLAYLGQFFAAFLGERRERETNNFAVIRWRDAET